jgi:DNA-directed RNA polymerase specialized sigma24 family protein
MAHDDDFVELIRRVRQGDEQASALLVHRYEPAIRIAVRARLTDARLRRWLDSMDVCQSVLGNFFARAATGEFELDRPEQLIALLATMARNRVTNHAIREQAARRDQRRTSTTGATEADPIDLGPDPAAAVDGRDLLDAVQGRLSDQERVLAEQWASGDPWAEIGARVGVAPDALRVRLARALARVRRDFRRSE